MIFRAFAAPIGVLVALAGAGAPAHAQWSESFVDMGVSYTLTDLTAGSSATRTYSLVLNTTGYTGPSGAFLDSVNIKAWDGDALLSATLLSAPVGGDGWTGTNGPINSGQVGTTGCNSAGAGFACVDALTKGIFEVALGAPYSFFFEVTATSADAFFAAPFGAHVGAGYANSSGEGAGYGITSYELATPIPEPQTYAMLVVGLGMLAFMVRRRRRIDLAAA